MLMEYLVTRTICPHLRPGVRQAVTMPTFVLHGVTRRVRLAYLQCVNIHVA